MAYIKVWIHLIWSTKKRERIISQKLKPHLIDHIRKNAKDKNIHLDFLNCVSDHVHLLISLKGEQNISKIVQSIKGESSHWINEEKFINTKFEWQDDFMAVSVSESVLSKVKEYIKNQEEHHKVKTFGEEYELFIEKYGFDKINQ